MKAAYYNEHDSFAAEWLRKLIAAGCIAPGEVDERDIRDVVPDELVGFVQCHFFAGIGGWSYALRLAGWPDDRPVWTGSCPCQPFSAAGRGAGFADERHLWPSWFHLIRQCRPVAVFGEQVASKDGLQWLDLVHADLESAGYTVGAADLPAAGVGAPHIRQRLFFVADAGSQRRQQDTGSSSRHEAEDGGTRWDGCRAHCNHFSSGNGEDNPLALAHPNGLHSEQPAWERAGPGEAEGGRALGQPAGRGAATGGVGNAESSNGRLPIQQRRPLQEGAEPGGPGPVSGFWSSAVWLPCRDGKARPTEPGIFPLASGIPNRVGTLRGAGNAICPQVGAEFIRAYAEARGVTL